MKKSISVLLVLLMVLTPLTAFATMPVYDASWARMGDVNYDGRINAADARLVLRYSAKLETTEFDPYCSDTDGNGKINAFDARTILRVAAGMSQFVCGFDGNRVPCVINTLKSERYSLEASYDETGTGLGKMTSIILAKDDDNIYFANKTVDGFEVTEPTDGPGMPEILGIGMLLIDDLMYAIMLSSKADFAIPINDALIEAMGKDGDLFGDDLMIDAELLKQTSDLISEFIADDIGLPTKVTVNDEEMFCYSYTNNDKQYLLYVDSMGAIKHIDGVSSNGNIFNIISFNNVSGDRPDEYFNIDNYAVLEFF